MLMGSGGGKWRVRLLLGVCIAVFLLFLGRLLWMQFYCADSYAAKAASASTASYSATAYAARGAITDRSGIVLRQDTPVYDVQVRFPAPPGTDCEKTIRSADQIAGIVNSEDVETQLAAFSSFSSTVAAGEFSLLQGISGTQAAKLRAAGLTDSGAVRLSVRGVRADVCGGLMPQILGATGAITAQQWPAGNYALRQAGYNVTEDLGQSGLEAALEQILHPQSGRLTVHVRRDGSDLNVRETTAPHPGNTAVLTVDANLQRTVQNALCSRIAELRATKEEGKGRETSAGAAVVVDTHTGGILAAASWPDYDPAALRTDYAALAADPALPLLDRVCQGLYAPGSAFKPAVAAAALSSGLITPQDTVNCTGTYTYYAGYQPHCLGLHHSGNIDLFTALKYSCNIFFYDVGRRLGVDAFSAAAQQLGLAADSGVEPAHAVGKLTWSSDDNYQSGLVLQAAIGQGNTAVTPLELASYACTLANNGTRYRLHFLSSVQDSVTGRTLQRVAPEVLSQAPGGEQVFGPIREGMKAVSTTLLALQDLPISIACKTGSPQRSEQYSGGYYTNSVLVAYAPADDPQIAVSIVLEYGGGGANAAAILRTIVEYFFSLT